MIVVKIRKVSPCCSGDDLSLSRGLHAFRRHELHSTFLSVWLENSAFHLWFWIISVSSLDQIGHIFHSTALRTGWFWAMRTDIKHAPSELLIYSSSGSKSLWKQQLDDHVLVNDEILQVGEQPHVLDARRQISASLNLSSGAVWPAEAAPGFKVRNVKILMQFIVWKEENILNCSKR